MIASHSLFQEISRKGVSDIRRFPAARPGPKSLLSSGQLRLRGSEYGWMNSLASAVMVGAARASFFAVRVADSVPRILAFLLASAAGGRVTPGEAEKLARLTGEYLKAVEMGEIEERLRRLEEAAANPAAGAPTSPQRRLS